MLHSLFSVAARPARCRYYLAPTSLPSADEQLRWFRKGNAVDVERNARTQVLYREVNERMRSIDESFGGRQFIEVMCECGRGCTERLEVPRADYERARGESTYFLVAASHLASEVDRVVEDRGPWLLVEAVGAAAAIARSGGR